VASTSRPQVSRAYPVSTLAGRPVPDGVIEIEDIGDGWWHIAIGRASRTKHFNLNRSEAAGLVRLLCEQVLTEDGSQ
jgi:hypothetical protein